MEKLKLQLGIKALKRKTELVQSALNREQAIDLSEVEIQVAFELAEAEAAIMNELTKAENAKHLLTHLGSPETSADLRKIYRQLAKQLHPDVNPTLTEKQAAIWQMIKDAYDDGSVMRLKSLQLVFEKEIEAVKDQVNACSPDDLQVRIELLKEGIKLLHQEIVDIRNEFPFNVEHLIKDEEWVAAETIKLQDELEQLRQYEEELLVHYHKLIALL